MNAIFPKEIKITTFAKIAEKEDAKIELEWSEQGTIKYDDCGCKIIWDDEQGWLVAEPYCLDCGFPEHDCNCEESKIKEAETTEGEEDGKEKCCFCEEEPATEWHVGDGYCYDCALANSEYINEDILEAHKNVDDEEEEEFICGL